MDKPDPSKISNAVAEMRARAKVCNDLMGGTETMRKMGRLYLPQEPAESDPAWEARLSKTVLLPAFEKAISTMVGKPFGQKIAIGKDVPPRLVECLENVDLAGRDFDTFSRDVFEQSLVDGIGWMIADYPRVDPKATLADERALNVRPYLIHVPLCNVCGWRSEIVNGVHRLTQFRYKECMEEPDGMFDCKTVERVRVWNRLDVLVDGKTVTQISVQVWQQDEKKEWVLFSEDQVKGIDEIPVVTVYTGRCGYLYAKPPLVNLAWLNVEHYQSRSDQRHILHFARVPLLFGKNLERDGSGKLAISGDRLICSNMPDSDLKVVEHSGAAIEAGRQDLQDIEDAMQRVAGEVVARVSGAKTATESDQEASDGESQLKKWLMTFEDALEEALRLMALWIGEKTGGEVEIAKDWDDEALGADMIQALSNAQVAGNLSRESVVQIFKDRGLLAPGREVKDELAAIDAEGPVGLGSLPPKLPKSDKVAVMPQAPPMDGMKQTA